LRVYDTGMIQKVLVVGPLGPVRVISWEDALNDIIHDEAGKWSVLEWQEFEARSVDRVFTIPYVIYSVKERSKRRRARWSKKGVLTRDNYVCSYCGQYGDTVDHVLPVAKGGDNTWENTCCACRSCNTRKGDMDWRDFGVAPKYKAKPPSSESHKHTKWGEYSEKA
jgi:5-methylcytosine-specific restriction endonuclease McrA